MHFDANLDGQFDQVYTLLTDYENLYQLNDDLLESVILSESNNGIFRLGFVARTCVLIFCFTKNLATDFEETSKGEFKVIDVAELSDFLFSQGTWYITPLGARQTRIRFEGVVRPSFWVPPLIGSALIRSKFRELSFASMQLIEHLVTIKPVLVENPL